MRLATHAENPAEFDVNRFVLEHGRMPFLSDPIPPWSYRGWLLFQVQFADAHPGAPGRWIHYLRTFEAGRLLDEPIPRIEFSSMPFPAGLKMIEKCVELLSYRDSSWTAFEKFVAWLAWGLSVSKVMPEIEQATSEALYRTFNFEPLILHPHDYLGHYLAERRSKGWNPNAYYPTPHSLCDAMAMMVFEGGETPRSDPRLRLVQEPAVGTGRMLLSASNYSYRLFGMDIDRLVVSICLCNGAFYAPWLSFPFPEKILDASRAPSGELETQDRGTLPRAA
ncbi:hypothetical protein ACFPT7_07215 [Acidicapsa dinghuensis]|uniref:SAM-dependent DNA methyltransferase n=1 Tax=Acidicapsa dinghuensis TaxID=2218256 RepID=A0ABW1EFQ2_9BACT|nr:hypothetical protein [Acidicapsa dinghuensis]